MGDVRAENALAMHILHERPPLQGFKQASGWAGGHDLKPQGKPPFCSDAAKGAAPFNSNVVHRVSISHSVGKEELDILQKECK